MPKAPINTTLQRMSPMSSKIADNNVQELQLVLYKAQRCDVGRKPPNLIMYNYEKPSLQMDKYICHSYSPRDINNEHRWNEINSVGCIESDNNHVPMIAFPGSLEILLKKV